MDKWSTKMVRHCCLLTIVIIGYGHLLTIPLLSFVMSICWVCQGVLCLVSACNVVQGEHYGRLAGNTRRQVHWSRSQQDEASEVVGVVLNTSGHAKGRAVRRATRFKLCEP